MAQYNKARLLNSAVALAGSFTQHTTAKIFKQQFVSFAWFHHVTSARKALVYRDSVACPEIHTAYFQEFLAII